MKQVSTLFLKIAVVAMGIPVIALCIFALPKLLSLAFSHAVDGDTLGYIVLTTVTVVYITVIPFFMALYQTIKLLRYIEKEQAFSQLSVTSLTKIKNYAKIISGLYLIILPLIVIVAKWDDAPGLILITMVLIGASFAVAVFSSVLQRLLQQAIEIKEENELTV